MKKKRANIISIILWLLAMISIIYLTIQIYGTNVLPSKYFYFIYGIIAFLLLVFLIFIINKKTKKWILIINDVIFVIVASVCVFGIIEVNTLMDFLKGNLGATYDTNEYYVMVNKNSTYNTLNDIENKTIKLVDDMSDKETLEKNIKKKVVVTFEYVDDITPLLYELETNTEIIVLVNSGNYDAMTENDEMLKSTVKFSETTKIIDKIEIKYKTVNETTGIDITEDPFIIYLSGIDTRSGKLPAKCLSDVNMLVVVNPKTHKILMVSTPRDYFVRLHGTTGLKDKLTHAGLVGGYQLSMQTLEDVYATDIKYYVRVNFNAIINIVDAIGGITINSDVNYTYTCLHGDNCVINPGKNNLNGNCAMGFVRERYAYSDGDRQRGRNQEQVLQKIIEKLTSSRTLIASYSDILKGLEGTFQTNVSTEEITSLVKMQLNDMPSWSMSSYNVTGSDMYSATYSFQNSKLYVMNPNEETVLKAREKIKTVLGN